ncbi:transcription factor MYB1R1-like [Ananas comosus]|uniref:Transcription factor MYB1R1 n=1 Tax=Ananas comosus TaxID=4615 RepID=A0A199W623_ANACO|nr:transcription factor MYB1R1-like [Ananas comosus]OAY84360.1 Transcription factor MYB1R1 [Ananas comosus]
MTRRCSHCSNNGHNSRTCPARGAAGGGGGGVMRLFGVRIMEGVAPMKKSASMGCLSSASAAGGGGGGGAAAGGGSSSPAAAASAAADALRDAGYESDDPVHASSSSNCRGERKRGIPWTEDEHRMFLLGLQKLGKGDWRGIARNFVVSRTPTQVASHAQKYFIRQTNSSRRKRRSSLFDMIPEMPMEQSMDQYSVPEEQFMLHSPPNEPAKVNPFPPLPLNKHQESELGATKLTLPAIELKETTPYNSNNTPPIPIAPTLYPAFLPVPLTFWPPTLPPPPPAPPACQDEEMMEATHEVVKPIPLTPKEQLTNVDEVPSISSLSLREIEPSALSLKLLGSDTPRQSAFHANRVMASARTDLNNGSGNVIHAV